VPFNLSNIGNAYDLLKMPDSALFYQKQALGSYSGMTHGPLKSLILLRLGNAYFSLDRKDSALVYYYKALQSVHTINDRVNNGRIERKIAELYASDSRYDSSLYYARRSFAHVTQSGQRLEILETSKLMFSLFRLQNNIDSAFFYQNYAQVMTDSLYGPQKFKQLQLLMMDEQQRQQVALQEKEGSTNRIKFAALFSALGFSLLFAFILIRNNSNKQKANNLLKEQKEKIEETLSVLKATQSQLIQSEKMASLGELTAGIAHEIQNPLNFVNNFSEVNSELMEEIVQEAVKGNLEEVKTIARDVKENEEKINFHGKRASDIVKGMLQHSRGSSGKKELTDINNLCDEYLRLSYHGYRAKDKSFSAKYATDFDTSLPKLSVVPQDIGRVVLNLINNAFYAVSEKTKLQAAGYEPQVVVTTKENGDKILISVKDNGNGIPQNIVDKIFQPFFTTKPTGQGTGLGLSLSYDIVKAHGGELKVETKEGEGSTFIIELTS
jgi:signal transduction histidine kinase